MPLTETMVRLCRNCESSRKESRLGSARPNPFRTFPINLPLVHPENAAVARQPSDNRTLNPKRGLYANVSFDDYLSWTCVNSTLLSQAARSMAHFRAAEVAGAVEPTDAQELGS